ncbi:MAG: SDR family oxidoreductase [Pseudomonadales bacterium]|jgi:NAD(P)-dependent dehydrogenase (short-subunit alcohol dehydrogenase family)|nr:SDR family oxidoreductase [Pseudomonadales bacterium]MDP6470192.1 SDR family oxidoreductase [Pseudomonadales bacterium]MDP6971536.1 SDR family oxidoreductase [Pseudomonadales bacterium]
MEVEDKIIVVTGGASGIGRAMAERFVADGARQVVVADINAARAKQVADEISAWSMGCDVSREADIVELIDTTEDKFGPIDLFCSNAGIGIGKGLDEPNEVWENIWQVNAMSHVYAARHLVPRMIARGGGYLLNTSSAAGLLSQIGSVTYAVTKHAAVALAEWISITHGRDGIKVSVLCPQAVRTAMTAGGPGVASVDGMLEPEQAADTVIEALREERLLILPHPEVAQYIKRKTSDYDRWLHGMRCLQEQYLDQAES